MRLCGDQGDLIRAKLRRDKALKLALPPRPAAPYSADEKARMLEEAQKLRSKNMYAALVVDLNCGLRDKELREIRWRADRPRPQEGAHGGQVEDRRRHRARDPAERNGHGRARGARRVVHPAVR